ncbi:MAG TPA: DUF6377 domain-containing protein [Flavitalea sp.]|nr:DUF6377 domain-containing protein [Flavitalea sp.]
MNGQASKNEWLKKLQDAISKEEVYDSKKLSRIDSLRHQLNGNKGKNAFDQYLRLYNEFVVFNFDSAWFYARELQKSAASLKDTGLITYAAVKLKFVLLSSGMYKEVFDSLDRIDSRFLSDSGKGEYYVLLARCYFDLSDYNHNKIYSTEYNLDADRYIDSSLHIFTPNSFEYHYYSGLKELRESDLKKASAHFGNILNDPSLSLREQALLYSTISDIYIRKEAEDSAIMFLARAAIADIESSTKETSAIFNLATLLFKKGDISHANQFIQKAASDARRYGARQRMLQLSSILPLIEAERLSTVETEKSNIINYAVVITFFLLALCILVLIIISQIRKLKRQKSDINIKNTSLRHLLEEKEWLIMEIHHRVKNNLHTISSLLESQTAYLQSDALAAMRDTQHRVFAMSLIHQKLYEPERKITAIDMSAYIHELVDYLRTSFETGNRIQFKMDLDPVELDISLASPMGLILNEAITNAFKYAFPGNQNGEINICIKKKTGGKYIFIVSDNGIGLPKDFNIFNTKSLGMKLMKGLSDDIEAVFSLDQLEGTTISVEFTKKDAIDHSRNVGGQTKKKGGKVEMD